MATVVGLFDNAADAQSAVEELIAGGWTREDISAVTPQQAPGNAEAAHFAVKETERGAVIGGLAGLLLGMSEFAVPGVGLVLVGGWLAAALLGAGVGAAAGGLVGLLVEAGVPHEEAGPIAESVRQGGTLVTVKADEDRSEMAEDILRRHHARHIRKRAAR
jgi:uncharacterized membrane protein